VQLVKSEGILNITLAVSPKPSFLFNERIYSKLITERDQLWAVNALEATALPELAEQATAWAIAVIYFIANPKLSKKVRFATRTMLERVLVGVAREHRNNCADVLVRGIEESLRQVFKI